MDKYTCSICGGKFTGYGNNPAPFGEGRCCDKCNLVICAGRIKSSLANEKQLTYLKKTKTWDEQKIRAWIADISLNSARV